MSFVDVVSQLDKFQMSELNKEANVGFSTSAHWYLVKIKNLYNNKRDFTVYFDNPLMDDIAIYQLGKVNPLLAQLGDMHPYDSITQRAMPNIKVALNGQQEIELVIRTESTGPAIFPITLFEGDDFNLYKDAVFLLWGSFIGIVLLMCIYNLILFLGVNDKIYLIYIGYVSTFLLTIAAIYGFLIYLVPDSVNALINKYIVPIQFLTAYFSLLFGLYFLRFDQEPKRLITHISKKLALGFLAGAFFSMFFPERYTAGFFFLMQAMLYVIAVSFIVVKLKERVRWAYFYLLSWLPLFIGAAISPLLITGNLDYSFWTRHALLLGVLFEMTFISMALADRLRTSEAQRLHQASHDHLLGLANVSLLKQKTSEMLHSVKDPNFSLVLFSISKYESMVPYMNSHDLRNLVEQFVSDIEHRLSARLLLVELSPSSKFTKACMIRDGVFGFVVSSNDDYLLSNVLKEIASKQPLNYRQSELTVNLNCLIGAASYSKEMDDANAFINKAQQAIDYAFENSKQWWIYGAANRSAEGRKVRLASDLQHAIENNDLVLYHQPQLRISDEKVVSSEVLLRWQHPRLGYISPEEFILVAENTGLINKVSQWVFDTACRHMCIFNERGLHEQKLSVNVSVLDVLQDGFLSFLITTIEKYQLKADRFVLELTETATITDVRKFDERLKELAELGFVIAMDDFGTGYSSITYVSRHPFKEIKIDREFVKDIEFNHKNQSIVSATINMANSLELSVVAEGVETQKALLMLKELNCDIAQGYYYSKPLPLDAYFDWLEEWQIKQEMAV